MSTQTSAPAAVAPAAAASESSSQDLLLVKGLLSFAVASVPQLLQYADKVPVVNSAVKFALPTLEPFAKKFVAYSEPVVERVDENLNVVYKSVRSAKVVQTLVAKVPEFELPLSNSFSALLELSDGQVDFWLPAEAEESSSAASSAEPKPKPTVSTLTAKVSKRAQKKLVALKLYAAPAFVFAAERVALSKELALKAAEPYRPYVVSVVENSKQALVQVSSKLQVAEYLASQRAVLVERLNALLAFLQKKSAELPEKDEVVKRAGFAYSKFQSIKFAELSEYALLKLKVKADAAAAESTGASAGSVAVKPEEVEGKLFEFLAALGQAMFLQELVAQGNALMKSSTATTA